MEVLKFGGSSVGTMTPLLNLKDIVESRKGKSVIVVVSALGGVTDSLLHIASEAKSGGKEYKEELKRLMDRHFDMLDQINGGNNQQAVKELKGLQEELEALLGGVCALRILPAATLEEIASFGERMSSRIVTCLLDGAELYDSLEFIRTRPHNGRNLLDEVTTEELIKEKFWEFSESCGIAVVPGFISRDTDTGVITTLGRGGSDYTASILAATLQADNFEIWTDVDGFMTADPRIVKTAYVLDQLSFHDAMELCNFGAKVIYPPALYPVFHQNIPVHIKNTFNPAAEGSVIRNDLTPRSGRYVTGISSISDSSIVTVSGTSMAGIIGVDGRIFSALAGEGISVFLVCQSSSETSISFGINGSDSRKACQVLEKEFAREITQGSMDHIQVHNGLSTIAIVGGGMKGNAGIAGKLFTTLGRNGISVIAFAQGTEESNISFVVDKNLMAKSLNAIHDSFFLSEYQELNLFLCGVGTVGGSLLHQIASQREKLMKEHNLKLNVVAIIRSKKAVFKREGIDIASCKKIFEEEGIPCNAQTVKENVIGMNIFNAVFVDCTASAEIADLYEDFFNNGISVVAANKIAASSPYTNYLKLKTLARKKGVKFLFETNVGAGLPIINTINALCNSGDKIEKIEAVLSGTLNFIFNTLSADIPLSQTVRMAKEMGYSEPDPRIDLSGKDVMRKLVILARESGYEVNQEDIEANLFIPKEFFDCSMEEFWEKLPSLDADFESRRKVLEKEHKQWRFVARMENGHYSVSLQEFTEEHPFYILEGSNNIILLTTERYHEHPMLIQGYGAGAEVTAAGVFADIMSIAKI